MSFFNLKDFEYLLIPEQGGPSPYKLKQEISLYIMNQANRILEERGQKVFHSEINGIQTLHYVKNSDTVSEGLLVSLRPLGHS